MIMSRKAKYCPVLRLEGYGEGAEATMVYFKVLSRYLVELLRKTTKT
jgi:hypothetical protein